MDGGSAIKMVEAFNGYCGRVRFGDAGVIADNDSAEEEQILQFNSLLANCVIFDVTLDMIDSAICNARARPSPPKTSPESPLAEPIKRFGDDATDEHQIAPDPVVPHVHLDAGEKGEDKQVA